MKRHAVIGSYPPDSTHSTRSIHEFYGNNSMLHKRYTKLHKSYSNATKSYTNLLKVYSNLLKVTTSYAVESIKSSGFHHNRLASKVSMTSECMLRGLLRGMLRGLLRGLLTVCSTDFNSIYA